MVVDESSKVWRGPLDLQQLQQQASADSTLSRVCAAKSMRPLSVVSGIHLKVLPWWSMTTAKWVGGSWISSSRSRVDRKP